MNLGDRIAVLYEGEMSAQFKAGQYTTEEIGLFMAGKNRRMWQMKWISSKQAAELGKSLAAIVLALVIGALFILVAGESPATAYSSLLKGALGTPQAVANTVSKSIPLAFTGLAVALGSRCGMLNIGAEGQLHAGAMAATLTGLTLSFLPAPILWL